MTQISKDMLALYDRIPWFFNQKTPDIDINEWILEQNRRTDTSFLKYAAINPFSLEVIEKLKAEHLWTVPLVVGQYSALTGVFIWNGAIVMMSLIQHKDEWIALASIHANTASKLFDFIRIFGAYEVDMEESNKTGFGR